MFDSYAFSVKDRLLRYVQIDTQSDPASDSTPSTPKQKDLGRLLVQELHQLGVTNALMDDNGYAYAHLSSSVDYAVTGLFFCSHMDTAPDCSGTGVKPLVHENYDGSDLVLPDDPAQVITVKEHPYLASKVGETLITASGTTLLGADDKAGIAVIMDLVQFFQQHPELPHGPIDIVFTPDEEIGRGVDKIDRSRITAVAGYTLDGGERGSLEWENFSADGVTIEIFGVSAHPGDAKDKMVNAIKVAADFIDSLPKDELSPESTEDRYGFVHPVQVSGITEKVTLHFIIRDFMTVRLEAYENFLRDKLEDSLKRFPGARATFTVKEQYRNMREVLDQHPKVVERARKALMAAGCTPKEEGIRGGTDGARLSFMGLPCPNLFTGEMALHGKHEYVSVQDMQKSVEVAVRLAMIWAEEARG